MEFCIFPPLSPFPYGRWSTALLVGAILMLSYSGVMIGAFASTTNLEYLAVGVLTIGACIGFILLELLRAIQRSSSDDEAEKQRLLSPLQRFLWRFVWSLTALCWYGSMFWCCYVIIGIFVPALGIATASLSWRVYVWFQIVSVLVTHVTMTLVVHSKRTTILMHYRETFIPRSSIYDISPFLNNDDRHQRFIDALND